MTQTWRPGLRTYHRKCFSKSRFIYKYHRPTLHLSHLLEMLRVVLVMASPFYSLHRWQSVLAPKWAASSGGDCCGSTEEREAFFGMQSPEASPSLPAEFQRPETNPRIQSSKDDLGSIPLGQRNC